MPNKIACSVEILGGRKLFISYNNIKSLHYNNLGFLPKKSQTCLPPQTKLKYHALPLPLFFV
jgi:hypothetical protein